MITDIDRIGMAFQAGQICLAEAYRQLIYYKGVPKGCAYKMIRAWREEMEKTVEVNKV